MGVQTETAHAGEFLISEANRSRSRNTVTVAASQTLLPGHILGRTTEGALAAEATASAGNTGNGAMGAITVDAGAKLGIWRLVIVEPASSAGVFTLEDPDGEIDGTGDVAAAYNGKLNFTLADGATDFAAGDMFEIEVAQGDALDQFVALTLDGADGSERVAAISFGAVETAADETAEAVVIDCDAEVNGHLLTYPDGASASQKVEIREQLRRLGIRVR